MAALLILVSGCTGITPTGQNVKSIPHLEKRGNVTQLIVDGEAYLALAGELHNSSSSSSAYTDTTWSKLKAIHLNTVLAVVSWEQVEPEEGIFDFSEVDDMIASVRQNDLRLAILWFGAWKNGITSYVPEWVKANQERFPFIKTKEGASLPILSTLGEATVQADAKAYGALMKHIKDIDSTRRTVIMIQMQNEVGLHGDTRDYSPKAVEMFQAAIPEELMTYLNTNKESLLPELKEAWAKAGDKTSGTWEEIFGQGDYTDELFMAWNYARYLNKVSAAGKAEYPLPTFVNAWIVQPQDKHPGDYPSGGPQCQNHDIWRAGAPSIDILAPDIYLPDFPGILAKYSRSGNPVFIPESSTGANGAANAFFAFGQMGAMGYSPFGIDGRVGNPNTDPISLAYSVLDQLSGLITEHQAAGTIGAAWLKSGVNPSTTLTLGKYKIRMELARGRGSATATAPATGYGMAIMLGPDEFIIAGANMQTTFAPVDSIGKVALAKVQDGTFVNGEWIPGRWLNGDETQLRYDLLQAEKEGQSGFGIRFRDTNPGIQRVWLYKYK